MITIVGLGPGSLDRVPAPVISLLLDPGQTVVARTAQHPAAAELAARRDVTFCDDLYEAAERFEDAYDAIRARVLAAAGAGPVIYAVPGSPMIGEFAVREIIASGHETEVIAGESFLDAILAEVRYDPFDRGLQLLNGHELPDP
jgi:tetrapyrrole methylase family protein/MazG family protein